MLEILPNIALKEFTTLKVGGRAHYFSRLKDQSHIGELVQWAINKSLPLFILGGGSNVIVTDEEVHALVIKNEIMGKEIISESHTNVLVSVGAGEQWDEFVEFCVGRGFAGVEALSAIPGTVGGAPIQNIGAYGVEVCQVIDSVVIYDVVTMDFQTLTGAECQFGYRDSLFKKTPGRFVVLKVVFTLSKNTKVSVPEYPGVAEKLKERNISEPTLKDIREVITEIRANKLPDPRVIPNVGSFFKNPIISREIFEKIKADFPNIKYFEVEGGVKIPAGWLIETAGLKGINFGAVGTYINNAMVLVNNGDATFMDIKNAEEKIKTVIKEKFKIILEREPIILDFPNP